jgi:hypothetical protein
MSRLCPHCGASLPPVGDAFCPECRKDLDESPQDDAALPAASFPVIVGAEGLSLEELAEEIERGGRLVVYYSCVSVGFVTFLQPSRIHLVRAGRSALLGGLGYTLASLLLGWWGFPWGFLYTPYAIVTNLRGGKDVTATIADHLPPVRAASP